MGYAVPAWEVPNLPVAGSADRFPVRRIYCIGRNYAAHAREMGADEREPPFFFLKPGDAIVQEGATIPYPVATGNLHYEAELVTAIGKSGANISVEDANDHVFGYGVGIDLTRRDLQNQAKEMRRPWDMGKAADRNWTGSDRIHRSKSDQQPCPLAAPASHSRPRKEKFTS